MNTPPIATMRPQTPDFNFAQQAPPSSPPETPTSPTFHFGRRSRRHGMHFPGPPLPPNGQIKAHGNGPHFSYNPSLRPEDLSPRSSSPSSESSGSPPRSLASSVRSTSSEPEPAEREHTPPRIITSRANFTLEEMTESDFDDYDSDDEDIIRPDHYEDAESDHAHSFKEPTTEIDPRVLKGFKDLACEEEAEMDAEAERDAWVEAMRAEKRRKRRSSSSVQKRTISQSIGSDTDDEDMVAPQLDADEAGSTARRLRRKTDRSSLIFDDPPPRIDELEEPESCEEIVEVNDDDDMIRALPYWRQEMDVDSDDE